MILEVLPSLFSICRLDSAENLPKWATRGLFYSITKTADELSVVCAQSDVPDGVHCEGDWRCFKVRGPLEFGQTGVLSSLSSPLAKARITIFVVSTFETDYVLVKQADLEQAMKVLSSSGHDVVG